MVSVDGSHSRDVAEPNDFQQVFVEDKSVGISDMLHSKCKIQYSMYDNFLMRSAQYFQTLSRFKKKI